MELKARVLKAHQHSTIEELNTARDSAESMLSADNSGIHRPGSPEGRAHIHSQHIYWNTVIDALDELLAK